MSVGDIPERFEAKAIYVVGDKCHKWIAAFICLCGCGQLNLLKDGDVSWSTTIHKDSSITIRPPI